MVNTKPWLCFNIYLTLACCSACHKFGLVSGSEYEAHLLKQYDSIFIYLFRSVRQLGECRESEDSTDTLSQVTRLSQRDIWESERTSASRVRDARHGLGACISVGRVVSAYDGCSCVSGSVL